MASPLLTNFTSQDFDYQGIGIYQVTDFTFSSTLLNESDIIYNEIIVEIVTADSGITTSYLAIPLTGYTVSRVYDPATEQSFPKVNLLTLPIIPVGAIIILVRVRLDIPLIQPISLNTYVGTESINDLITRMFNRVYQVVQLVYIYVGNMLGAVYDKIASVQNILQNNINTLADHVDTQDAALSNRITTLATHVDTQDTALGGRITNLSTSVNNRFTDVNRKITDINTNIDEIEESIQELDNGIPQRIEDGIDNRIDDDYNSTTTSELYSNQYTEQRINESIASRFLDNKNNTRADRYYSGLYTETRINQQINAAIFPDPVKYQTDVSITDNTDPRYLGSRSSLFASNPVVPDNSPVIPGDTPEAIANKLAGTKKQLSDGLANLQYEIDNIPPPAPQVQSDAAQRNTGDISFIKNSNQLMGTAGTFTPSNTAITDENTVQQIAERTQGQINNLATNSIRKTTSILLYNGSPIVTLTGQYDEEQYISVQDNTGGNHTYITFKLDSSIYGNSIIGKNKFFVKRVYIMPIDRSWGVALPKTGDVLMPGGNNFVFFNKIGDSIITNKNTTPGLITFVFFANQQSNVNFAHILLDYLLNPG